MIGGFRQASFASTILLFSVYEAKAEDWMDKIEISGTVETEWSISTDGPNTQKLEVVVQPEIRTQFTDDTSLTAILRLRGDVEDNLEPGNRDQNTSSAFSSRLLVGDYADIELREFFIDTYVNEASIRFGKQQVVWGQADGLKVLDVINPQSYREFILDDFDDSRIPLWSLNAEIPVGDDSAVQFLWVPDTTYHDLPETDADFAFSSSRVMPRVPAGYTVSINEEDRPTNILEDSDLGMRFSAFMNGWDLTFNYLYHYNDTPVLYREITGFNITVNPEYERTHLIGGTLSKAFGDFILRSEVGYSTNTFHVTHDAADADGIKEAGEAAYVVGLDYSGFEDTFLSAQFFQSVLTKDFENVTRDQIENTVTFLAERTFANETWKVESLFLHSINDGDGLIRPKVSYELASNVNVWAGADIFYGKSDGLYGQFKDQDRINVGFDWGF